MTEKEFTETCKELTSLLDAGFKGRCKDIYHFHGEHIAYDVWYNSETGNAHFLLDGAIESVGIWFSDVRYFRGTVLLLYRSRSVTAANNALHRKKRQMEMYFDKEKRNG